MGEAKKRATKRGAILDAATRCIYCGNPPTTLDHMPPISCFRGRQRPCGLEFASCDECNSGLKGADGVAAFMARMDTNSDSGHWMLEENLSRRNGLETVAPGVLDELFDPQKAKDQWVRNSSGILVKKTFIKANGPLLRAYLDIFAAKMGMALYREMVGQPLTMDGGVHVQWFLNAGLSRKLAAEIINKLPGADSLRQGSKNVLDQFIYRYNTDEKTISAALSNFNGNLHIFTVATSDPEFYGFPKPIPHSSYIKPGQLTALLPRRSA